MSLNTEKMMRYFAGQAERRRFDSICDRRRFLATMGIGGLFFTTRGAFALRACIVNFRTESRDVAAVPEIVARHGREVDRELRPR